MNDNEHILMKIGILLREIRIASGYTQSDLKEKGINRTLLSRVESGNYNITIKTLGCILNCYGISLSQFFDNQSGYFDDPE